jgi:hypothetical protein
MTVAGAEGTEASDAVATPGAAQDGIERHDDRKPLHSSAKNGTYRQNAAHNAAQVHSLPSALAHDGSGAGRLAFSAAQDGMKRHDGGKVLHSAAKIGTYRQNAAHNAAQVHSLSGSLGASILAAFSARHKTALNGRSCPSPS